MENILDFLNNQFNKIYSEIKGVKIYKPKHDYIDLKTELIKQADTDEEVEYIEDYFPDLTTYKINPILTFEWTKPMNSDFTDLNFLDFNSDKYFIEIFNDEEDVPSKLIAAIDKHDLKNALRVFLNNFFACAGFDYVSGGIWGLDTSYEPNEKTIHSDLIDQKFMDECYAKCMIALGKSDDGNKVILTQVTPKMSKDEIYDNLVKNLKKQGIEVKPDKKKK